MTHSASDTIRPNYMQKFQCIGGACEDSCCAGWRVVFDKRTAQSYLAADDPEIREIATKSIKKIKTDRSSQNHSFVQMNPQTGGCPFLEVSKLCMIQGKMGEAALSKVCSTYPRQSVSMSGHQYQVATLSCPEAARLCLLDPDAMKLGHSKISSSDQLSLTVELPQLSAIQYLHQTAIEMLEDDRVSIIEFVLVYGSALNILRKNPDQAFTEGRRFSEIQKIIEVIRISLADTQANAMQAREAVHFQLGKVLPILLRHSRNNMRNVRFQESLMNSLNGILPNSNDLKASTELYEATLNSLSKKDLLVLKSALRNYLLNDLLKNTPLYNRSPINALRGLQAAIVRLSIFVIQIIGTRAFLPDCSVEKHITLIVSSTARVFEHNSTIMVEIANYLDSIEDKSVAVLGLITPRLE